MVEKFLLALDYETDDEAIEKGTNALNVLREVFGRDFVVNKVGVKINEDLLTGAIDPRHREFADNGNEIFGDLKISHGADTAERIIDRIIVKEKLPLSYVTFAANMGATILSKFAQLSYERNINPIAFTAHTKILEEEVKRMYGNQNLDDVIYNLGSEAYKGNFDAMVCEAERLNNQKLRDLKIKKLVTGIRIDVSDKGTQSRITALDELSYLKQFVDYVVVSSRYVNKPETLAGYFAALL